jgi:hypothetical protein
VTSCAFPGCHRPLVSADAPEQPGAVIAEVAHIVAERREGPRGSGPLSEEERNQPANLIVLCPEHHKLIDSQPKTYSIVVLRQMKIDHLAEVRRRHRSCLLPDNMSSFIAEKLDRLPLQADTRGKARYIVKRVRRVHGLCPPADRTRWGPPRLALTTRSSTTN